MRLVTVSIPFVDTFRAMLTSGLMVLASLVVLEMQLISSASAEVTFLNSWGSFGTGDGQFKHPNGVAVSDTGQVYVVDQTNHRIQRFDADGTYETQWGSQGSGDGKFNFPIRIAVSGTGQVYVADRSNYRIQRFDADGTYEAQWGSLGSGDGEFNTPVAVAVSGTGQVYVADEDNDRIQRFDADGTYETQWGSFGSDDGEFDSPFDVAASSTGQVFVADTANNRIQRFDVDGTYVTQWGSLGSGDGKFRFPTGVVVSGTGQVYVMGRTNHRIQRFDADGTYETQWGSFGTGDGEFDFLAGIAVSGTGLVYVADRDGSNIERFFDSDAWLSGTNTFVDGGVGPTSVAVGPGGILGASLTLDSSKGLAVGNMTTINTGGSLSMSGGTLSTSALLLDGGTFAALDLSGINTLQFNSGTLNLTGQSGLTVDSVGPLGSLVLNAGDALNVTNTTTIATGGSVSMNGGTLTTSILLLDGGTFAAPDMTGISTLQFNTGILNLTASSGLTIEPGSPLGASITVGSNQSLIVDNATTIASGGSLSVSGGTLTTTALLLDGGMFTAPDLTGINTLRFNTGTLNLPRLTVDAGGPLGSLVLNAGDALNVTTTTTIATGGSISMNGGTLSTPTLLLDGGTFAAQDLTGIGTLQFNTGTLNLTGPSGLTVDVGGLLGASVTVGNGQSLIVDNTTTIASGGSVSMSAGTLSTSTLLLDGGTFAAPDLAGINTLQFNAGTLNLTGPSGLTVGTAGPLRSLVLNAGNAVNVTKTTTIATGGSISMSGGTLNTSALLLDGGTFEAQDLAGIGTLQFSTGILHLTGPAGLTVDAGGLLGASLTVSNNLSLIVDKGLINYGTLDLLGGTLSGGSVTNDFGGLLNAEGTIDTDLNNNGTMRTTGGLVVTGLTTNVGLIEVGLAESLRSNGDLNNSGVIELTGGVVASGGTVTNQVGGIIRGGSAISSPLSNNGGLIFANGSSTLVIQNFTGNINDGELRIGDGSTMNVVSAFTNDGTIRLRGVNATLVGGAIANSGTIKGVGRVVNAIANAAVIRAEGGELTLAGSGQTNTASGWIEARTGAAVLYTEGLANNAGTIALTGGGFDNGGNSITNTGLIIGYGEFRSGGLGNDGSVGAGGGNLKVIGDVTNSGLFSVQGGDTVVFFNNVSGNGVSGSGTVKFLQGFSPGASPAEVSFGGNVIFTGTSTLTIELAGTAVGKYDRLLVADMLDMAGDLEVHLLANCSPTIGNRFHIFDAMHMFGSFSSVVLPDLLGNLSWDRSHLHSSGILSVIPEPTTLTLLAVGTLLACRRRL